MLMILAIRHLLVKRLRSLFLLLGYGLGVGVMIVLLSVGEAMLDQARDVSLVGGGEVTVLPEGIDVEALRTGGLSGMFFGIDRARFVTRQGVGGPRYRALVASVAPAIEGKLVYVQRGADTVAVLAGGEIPSRASAVGAGHDLLAGRWNDSADDSAYVAPSVEQLYHQVDHFHLSPVEDSTWGEWHYFNLVTGPDEWWYVSLLVGGRVGRVNGNWGGQVLVTHRRRDGEYERFAQSVPSSEVELDTTRADLRVGPASVIQRDGVYLLLLDLPVNRLSMELRIRPAPNHYFPPVMLREGEDVSGYAVAALRASASGQICRAGRCAAVQDVHAYHDHNWGVWRDVSWDWGAASGRGLSLLYGRVLTSSRERASDEPFFVSLVDSLGILQILKARAIRFEGAQPAVNQASVIAPTGFSFVAYRERDTVLVRVSVREALASRMGSAGFERYFLQMRGGFQLSGIIGGRRVADEGEGFFETFRER